MRAGFSVSVAVVAASLISGCTTMTESEYKTGQSLISESPTVKRIVMEDCVADSRKDSPREQKELAAVLNVSVSNYPTTFCRRLINAYASGRITYEDYVNLRANRGGEEKIIRILQGK